MYCTLGSKHGKWKGEEQFLEIFIPPGKGRLGLFASAFFCYSSRKHPWEYSRVATCEKERRESTLIDFPSLESRSSLFPEIKLEQAGNFFGQKRKIRVYLESAVK